MARNYSSLSGAAMVAAIRKRNQRNVVLCILGIAAAAIILIVVFWWMKTQKHYVYGLVLVAIVALCVYAAVDTIGKARKTLADVENCRLFRKFGSPDTLAAKISEESSAPLLDSKGALICDSFAMNHGNFESYIPFDQILLIYRKEHRTNGILDSVSLVVHDAYGDSQQYPFKLGRKGSDQMQGIMQHIMERAPHCNAGYSRQNLDYAKQNARHLD